MATLSERLLNFVLKNSTKGDCTSVIEAIDNFSWKVEWTMCIGDEKGLILDQAFKDVDPTTVLELGAYCGYSALRMARYLKEGGKIYTVEPNEETIKVTKQVIEQAGMTDKINIIAAASCDVIPELSTKYNISSVDFMLLDHAKDLYYPDIHALEKTGLILTGSVVVADNIGVAGTENYLEYVTTSSKYNTIHHKRMGQYAKDNIDGVTVSVAT